MVRTDYQVLGTICISILLNSDRNGRNSHYYAHTIPNTVMILSSILPIVWCHDLDWHSQPLFSNRAQDDGSERIRTRTDLRIEVGESA